MYRDPEGVLPFEPKPLTLTYMDRLEISYGADHLDTTTFVQKLYPPQKFCLLIPPAKTLILVIRINCIEEFFISFKIEQNKISK